MPPRTGSQNKNKAYLMNRLQEMYGDDFHPIIKMAGNAVAIQAIVDKHPEEATPELLLDANKAWEGIACYIEPKLKAIEMNHGVQEHNPIIELLKQISGRTIDPNESK